MQCARIGVFLILGSAPCSGWAGALMDAQDWRFAVSIDNTPVGYHDFSVTPTAEGTRVVSEASFKFKKLFITLFDYEHSNTEIWHGECLQEIDSKTHTNGDRFALRGRRLARAFVLSNAESETRLPKCVQTFAYWNPAFLDTDHLLNPQTGQYVPVHITLVGEETLEVAGEAVASVRYHIAMDDSWIDVWYGRDTQRWLGLESSAETGRKIRYDAIDARL